MPRLKPQALSAGDFLEQINDGLRTQVRRPNLLAYKPHTKQYAFHKSDKKVILYIGGNRSGKTTGGAVEACYRLLGRSPFKAVKPAPVRGRVHSVDFKYGVDQIILPEISRWLPPSALRNGSWEDSYNKENKILTLANKSTLEFKSYEQDLEKFAGTSRDFCWYDEEPPKHIFNESQARLVDVDGDAFLTMTPLDGITWVYQDIYIPGKEGLRNDVFIVEIETSENPYLSKDAVRRYMDTLDEDEREAREKGQFQPMGGRIFKHFSMVSHVVPCQTIPSDWELYESIDHGFNNPTAVLWHAVSPDNKIITFAEHFRSEMIIRDHAVEIKKMRAKIGREPFMTIGDIAMRQRSASSGISVIQEYADNGIYIGTKHQDFSAGINKMVEYLKEERKFDNRPTWQISEACPNLIREMRVYRWATYSSKKIQFEKNKQEAPHKKDDHAIDATRYFFGLMPDLRPDKIFEDEPRNNPLNAPVGTDPTKDKWDQQVTRQTPVGDNWEPRDHYEGDFKNEAYGTDLYSLEY